ncbi:class I SAM-dependent methyltransferase [Nocardia sp. NPDC056100]|uniref:class I SAM-dependent methyltransferase n=1 Tax=Nocardia sp. NPDC056100 TaxID=3345712 RepID=UPI0035E13713
MLDYDIEAATYDRTRGGDERAAAAAEAVRTLLPADARTVVDVACGTGIVSTRLRAPDRIVLGVDLSAGMLEYARPRLDGAVVRADATSLPISDATVDAVLFMWLLHLVGPEIAEQSIAEAARILRPGGVVMATADKEFAVYGTPSDLATIIEPVHRMLVTETSDAPTRLTEIGHRHGLEPAGQATYTGHGQGRSPRQLLGALPHIAWFQRLDDDAAADLQSRIVALPDQDEPRPDPVYRIARLRKTSS